MTTTTHTAMMNIAKQAAEHIGKMNGESGVFEVESNGYLAVIDYSAEIAEDRGDYFTAPAWWVENENISVEAVYNAEGDEDTEATKWLNNMLN